MDKHEGRMSKDTPRDDCEKCGGLGIVKKDEELGGWFHWAVLGDCPACHGTGKRREGR